MRTLTALFLLFPFFSPAHAAETKLHLMSYNIKGLPTAILSGEYKDERYGLIGRLLKKRLRAIPDIVVLQEAFSSQTRELIENAGFPFVAGGPPSVSLLGVSGGLYILSRFQILKQAERAFGAQNCLSWDCFSNKGVQMVRLLIPGLPKPLEVYNTHLQAGREDTLARQAQVKILLEFFRKEHESGNPVIFAGDFNFRPGLAQKSYQDFASGTAFLHAGKFCLEKGCAKGDDAGWHGIWERAVDHQFFSITGPVSFTPLSVERSYREPVEGLRLSDHPAHEVSYRLSWGESGRAISSASNNAVDVRSGGPSRQKLFTAPARRGTSVP